MIINCRQIRRVRLFKKWKRKFKLKINIIKIMLKNQSNLNNNQLWFNNNVMINRNNIWMFNNKLMIINYKLKIKKNRQILCKIEIK